VNMNHVSVAENMRNVLRESIDKIREINRRYSKPRIRMSRNVRFALLMLRLYLLTLVILLVYRFITLTLLK
jgi:hypothetical protein